MKIFNAEPQNWRELQEFVGQMFTECNFETEISKVVELARGSKEIDVYAIDTASEYRPIIFVECKSWNSKVKKETVHSFRTVINDFGANVGYIVSKNGFQSGCFEAAEKTNIKLVSLAELTEMYYLKWRKEMVKKYAPYSDPLRPYCIYSSPIQPKREEIDYSTHILVTQAYSPICDLMLPNYFEKGFVKYPISIPVIDDRLQTIGTLKIENDRDYFEFCDNYKDNALRHFRILFRERESI